MKGLILKDMILLKKHWFKLKYAVAIILMLAISIPLLQQSSIIAAIFITMLLLNSIQMLFIDDIKSGWIKFLNTTTDLNAKTIVLGRFISAVTVVCLANLILFGLSIIIYFIYHPMTIDALGILGLISLGVSIIYMLVLIPFTYLFDHNGMIIVLIFFLLTGFIVSRINNISILMSGFINETNNYMIFLSVLAGLIILGFVSFGFSTVIYNKRFINQGG